MASGNEVALKLVSFVVMVTVINVVLEVTLSLAPTLVVRREGAAVAVEVVESKLEVVLAAVTAMVRCNCFN